MSDPGVQHATITVERILEDSPARVFAAWADPDARNRRNAPGAGWKHVILEHDFRVGGRDVITFGPPGQPRLTSETRYDHGPP